MRHSTRTGAFFFSLLAPVLPFPAHREPSNLCRVRWRAQRRPIRLREQEADERDRALEAQQLAALNAQSESFLAQHADLLASSLPTPAPGGGEPDANGSSTPAPAPAAVKLNFSAAPKPAAQEAPKARPTAVTLEDEDESTRKKRALIPLEYSDDDDERPRLSRGEAERKAREIEARVPNDKEGLWAWKVRWKRLNDVCCFLPSPLRRNATDPQRPTLTGHPQQEDCTVRQQSHR